MADCVVSAAALDDDTLYKELSAVKGIGALLHAPSSAQPKLLLLS